MTLSQLWPSNGWTGRLVDFLFRTARPKPRRLRLSEVLSLGEKRFVGLIECEQRRFLIGGTAQSIRLLTEMKAPGPADRLIVSSRRPSRERMQ